MLTILVDMDDTMEGLLDAWTEFLNAKHGISTSKEDIKEWDMQKAYPTLSKEQIYAPLFEEKMWKNVKPLDGAVEYIQRLIRQGHEIVVVTASHYDNVGMKMRNVLIKHFPFIPYDNVVITSRKQMILGDVLIDDAPHNLIGGKYKGILFDAPHNRAFCAEKYGMRRVKNWKEIYEVITELDSKELQDLIEGLED